MALAEVTPLRTLHDRQRLVNWPSDSRPNALQAMLPNNALRPGSTVAVSGSTSLALATVVAAKQQGSWCAAINFSNLGLLAAAEAGCDLEKFALVPNAGIKWASVTAALIDAFDVVLLSLGSTRFSVSDARRLSARARERNAVLVSVLASSKLWPNADLRLECDAITWQGIGSGHGRLNSPQLAITVGGRGAAAQIKRGQIAMVAS